MICTYRGDEIELSVVVPIFNEEGNIVRLHKEICNMCNESSFINYEIIFIDDGSSDNTSSLCKDLKPLKYIRFRKNFGQTAAMDAGIKAAKYQYIATMDGDCQNDPNDIPEMLKYLIENDLDIVSGWRKNRKDTFLKRFISRGANFLRKIIVKDHIHDSGCSLKIYKKECFENLNLYGEMHRFIPALLEMKGFMVGEMVVNHRPRIAGKTKYNWKRTIKGFLDMVSIWFWNKYSMRPMHILGALGIICFIIGAGCGLWSMSLFFRGYKMSNNIFPPLLTVFFILMGLIMFIFGLLSEILIKIYYGSSIDHTYSIKDSYENIID